jgi:putative addiction module component (TIGR02574 family)
MSPRVKKLLAEAAQLPLDEREELAEELLLTLPDDEIDYEELDRRHAEVQAGTAKLISYEEARKILFDE